MGGTVAPMRDEVLHQRHVAVFTCPDSPLDNVTVAPRKSWFPGSPGYRGPGIGVPRRRPRMRIAPGQNRGSTRRSQYRNWSTPPHSARWDG